MKILNRYTKEVIFESDEVSSIRELVLLAVHKTISLSKADLRGVNLEGVNLEGANLNNANLNNANLRYANLYNANLYNANLENANLYHASLYNANLENANLYNANLENTNLYHASLRYTDLIRANLKHANLYNANLENANLEDANLKNTDLRGANLTGATLPDFLITPKTGSFQAYKKLKHGIIVLIEIPEHAERTNSLISKKCRTNEFKIIEVVENPNNIEFSKDNPLQSTHYKSNGYYVGGTFKEPNYNGDIRLECTEGLHFFMTLEEAQDW